MFQINKLIYSCVKLLLHHVLSRETTLKNLGFIKQPNVDFVTNLSASLFLVSSSSEVSLFSCLRWV